MENYVKKYYWLKLKKHFFQEARIKKIRKLAGGDTYVIIYLEIMLLAIDNNGVIVFENIEPTIEEELALKLDEEVENVRVAWKWLLANNCIQELTDNNYLIPESVERTGKELTNVRKPKKEKGKEIKEIELEKELEKEQELELDKRDRDKVITNDQVIDYSNDDDLF